MNSKNLTSDRIITVTRRIQKVYFALVCIGIIDTIYTLSGISETFSLRESIQGVINLLIYFFVYIGLRFRKTWVIPLVLISSAWLVVSTFLYTFQLTVDILGLLSKFLGIILVLFYSYQLHFFSKREVRAFFGTKGTIFF